MNRSINRTLLSLTFAALVLSACGQQSDDKLPEPVAAAVDAALLAQVEAELHKHTEILASDEYEGRAPATKGEKLTVDYLTAQFEALGLQPGNGESWTQEVPVTAVTTSPADEYQRELA